MDWSVERNGREVARVRTVSIVRPYRLKVEVQLCPEDFVGLYAEDWDEMTEDCAAAVKDQIAEIRRAYQVPARPRPQEKAHASEDG